MVGHIVTVPASAPEFIRGRAELKPARVVRRLADTPLSKVRSWSRLRMAPSRSLTLRPGLSRPLFGPLARSSRRRSWQRSMPGESLHPVRLESVRAWSSVRWSSPLPARRRSLRLAEGGGTRRRVGRRRPRAGPATSSRTASSRRRDAPASRSVVAVRCGPRLRRPGSPPEIRPQGGGGRSGGRARGGGEPGVPLASHRGRELRQLPTRTPSLPRSRTVPSA